MIIKRSLFTIIAISTLLTSCFKDEECPVIPTTVTFEFSSRTLTDADEVTALQVFLLDEVKNRVTAYQVDLSTIRTRAYAVSLLSTRAGETYPWGDPEDPNPGWSSPSVDWDVVTGNFAVTVTGLPQGSYRMWLWGNVADESVLSIDRATLSMRNGVAGGDYLLSPVQDVTIRPRSQTISGVLERLTARVTVAVTGEYDSAIGLYVSDVYGSVDADGVFGDPVDVEFESSPVPGLVCLFPTAETAPSGSEFFFSYYQPAGSQQSRYRTQPLSIAAAPTVAFDLD